MRKPPLAADVNYTGQVPRFDELPSEQGVFMSTAIDIEIRPFRVDIPDEALKDLRERIAVTQWPEREPAERIPRRR
jgi:hypothetical protein